jgi:steroid delta-isomerase-like uncharacterized protein
VSGAADAGGRIDFRFGPDFNPLMQVTAADPATGVRWECVGGVEQWADNTFEFALADHDGATRVRFRQEYATELSDDDYAVYNYNWAYYLESLRLYCTTGTGQPYRPGVAPVPAELISVARATPKADRVADLERELVARIEPTRAQPGNIEFSLYRSLDDPVVLLALEHWRSRPDWERHLQGAHIASLMAVFEDVLAVPPDIQISTPIPMERSTMSDSVAANKNVARRLASDVFSKGDLDAYDEIFADDYVNHNIPVPGIPGTKEGFRQLVVATRNAFTDLAVEVQDVVAEGDLVVFHDHVTATSTGEFFGVPPSGKPLAWTEIHFLRVRDGQIVEHWTNFDQLGILMQLGAIPS